MGAKNPESLYQAEAAVAFAQYEVRRLQALARLCESDHVASALATSRRRAGAAQRRLAKLVAKRRRARERLRLRQKLANARAGRGGRPRPCVTCRLDR